MADEDEALLKTPSLNVASRELSLHRVVLAYGVDRPAQAFVESDPVPSLQLQQKAMLEWDSLRLGLSVDGFRQRREMDSCSIELVDPMLQAKPFDLETFGAGGEGTCLIDVVRSKLSEVVGHGAVTAAGGMVIVQGLSLKQTIEDICARCQGHFWREGASLHLGELPKEAAVELPAVNLEDVPGGILGELDIGPLPRPGSRVRLDGKTGFLASAEVTWQADSQARCRFIVADRLQPVGRPHPPTGSMPLPGRVKSAEPLTVSIKAPSGEVLVDVCFTSRRLNQGKHVEQLPLSEGDELLVLCPVGGLATDIPYALPYCPTAPSQGPSSWSLDEVRIQARKWVASIEEDYEILVKQRAILQAKGGYEAHVPSYDIKSR